MESEHNTLLLKAETWQTNKQIAIDLMIATTQKKAMQRERAYEVTLRSADGQGGKTVEKQSWQV